MTSCQRLVPADLEANHPVKWIPPPHKRRHPFFFFFESLPVMPTSDARLRHFIHVALNQVLMFHTLLLCITSELILLLFQGRSV